VILGLIAAFLFFYRRRKARQAVGANGGQPSEMPAGEGGYHNDAAIAAGKAKPAVYGSGGGGGVTDGSYAGSTMTENRSELYSSMAETPNTPHYEMYSPDPGHPQTQQHYELYTPGPGDRL
jgi:hypothetical protein